MSTASTQKVQYYEPVQTQTLTYRQNLHAVQGQLNYAKQMRHSEVLAKYNQMATTQSSATSIQPFDRDRSNEETRYCSQYAKALAA